MDIQEELSLIDNKEEDYVDSFYNPVMVFSRYISTGQSIPTLTWEEL